jgi:hypothetical protein
MVLELFNAKSGQTSNLIGIMQGCKLAYKLAQKFDLRVLLNFATLAYQ